MTGIVIHKGPKPLIASMTESTGMVGVREGALWIPDEFNHGGSIRPARREGEWRRSGGRKDCLTLKGFLPPTSPISLSEYLFFSSSHPYHSFIYHSSSLQPHNSLGRLPSLNFSVAPSLCVASSPACRSPERATLAKQGIWRSEANLLWEVNTRDFCCPWNSQDD